MARPLWTALLFLALCPSNPGVGASTVRLSWPGCPDGAAFPAAPAHTHAYDYDPEQTLAAEDFVATGDTAGEIVLDVEYRAVALGDLWIQCQQIGVDRAAVDGGMDTGKLLNRTFRPH